MNSKDIAAALRHDKRSSSVFSGVYPSDMLPMNEISYPSAYVVNLDESHESGSHWISIFFDKIGNSEVFDSYGNLPLPPAINHFLKRHTKGETLRNSLQVQSFYSTVCGAYAIFYIMHRVRGFPMETIVNMFDKKDRGYNDRHVQQFVEKYTNRRHPLVDTNFVEEQFARAMYDA